MSHKSFIVIGLPMLLWIISIGAAGASPQIAGDFVVALPTEERPFPESLRAGEAPSFKIRGTKGWAWTPEQYLAEIPYLVRFKMNFLMNCYLSMFDIESRAAGDFRALLDAARSEL